MRNLAPHEGDEQQAIEAIRRGEPWGLEALVSLYHVRAAAVAVRIVRRHDIAETVVWESFLAVWDRIETYDARRSFRPWFFRILVNRALDEARREQRSAEHHAPEAAAALLADRGVRPEIHVLRRERQQTVVEQIDGLSPKLRAVVVLRYYLDMEEREMAETLGVPLGTVKWRLHMARRKLTDALAPLIDELPSEHTKGEPA